MIVRITGNSEIQRAHATSPVGIFGTVGVVLADIAVGAVGPVVTDGKASVLMDASLTLAPGEVIWVSPGTAGYGTNVEPANAARVALLKDTEDYDPYNGGLVTADIGTGANSGGTPTDLEESVHLSGGEVNEEGNDGAEAIIFEWRANFAGLDTATMRATWSAIARRIAGGTDPVARLYIGATAPGSIVGGTLIVGPTAITSLAAAGAFFDPAAAVVAKPAGRALVQITMTGGDGPTFGFMRGVHLMFEEV
jgi:hypothetical protein